MTPPPAVPTPVANAVVQRWPERGPQWLDAVEHELRRLCARYTAQPEQILTARYGYVVATAGAHGKLVMRASADPNGDHQAKVAAAFGKTSVGPQVHEIISTDTGTWTVMDRIEPGNSFSEAPPSDDVLDSLADTLSRMSRATAPEGLPRLTDWLHHRLTDDNLQDLPPGRTPAPRDDRDAAVQVLDALSRDASGDLGHGDLSPGNLLNHNNGQFLLIDPRGYDGNLNYDVAVLSLKTPQYGAPNEVAANLSKRLQLDLDAVLRWQSVARAARV